jgi:hypothetical protein
MKLVLIISHMAKHRMKPPTNGDLKKHSHDLLTLFEHLDGIGSARVATRLNSVIHGSLEYDILTCLSDFATHARYFNLNSLTAGYVTRDPLSQWNQLIIRIAKERIAARHIERVARESHQMSLAMQGIVTVVASTLDGKDMSVFPAFAEPRLHDLVSGHAMFHIVQIIKQIVDQLNDWAREAQAVGLSCGFKKMPVPHMREFFYFIPENKRDIMRKKRWS